MIQAIRKSIMVLLLAGYMYFMWFICPIEMMHLAYHGILGAAVFTYIALFISSFFVGRAFCGWLCPHGAFLSLFQKAINPKPIFKSLPDIRILFWVTFATAAILLFRNAEGISEVNYFHGITSGLHLEKPVWLAWINVGFVVWIAALSLLFGKRSWCNSLCPIALHMIGGNFFRKKIKLKSLKLDADKEKCIACKLCNKSCTMGIDVHKNIIESDMDDKNCILCGECIESCSKKVISYKWK